MPALAELQQKREALAKEIRKQSDAFNERKAAFDKDGKTEIWPDETRTAYDKVNADYDAVMEQLTRENESRAIEDRLWQLDQHETRGANGNGFNPNADHGERRAGGDGEQTGPTMMHRTLALQAWARAAADKEPTEEQRQAAKICGVRLGKRSMEVHTSETEKVLRMQCAFRSAHPSQAYERALSAVTAGSGGDTVPTGFVPILEVNMLAFDGMTQVATIMPTDKGNDLPWPTIDDTTNEGELVDENTETLSDEDPTTGVITFGAYKFSSKIVLIPYELLEDSAFNFAQVVGRLIGERIGRHSERLFTVGTGVSQPKGLITAASVGRTTASGTAITADDFVDLQHSVDPAYRSGPGVGFMMHDSIIKALRKLKDNDGQYIWRSGLTAGVPDSLLGDSVHRNQHMASSLAVNNKVAAYGDLSKYMIRRVNGLRLVRADERYVEKDQVGFIAFMRQDGNLIDAGTDPVKVLQMAAA